MIFQEPMTALNPSMTCGKQVYEAINTHLSLNSDAIKKRCLELFESVELPDPKRIYNSYPHQLSGGQKQRVMIAMALSCDPNPDCRRAYHGPRYSVVQKEILEMIKRLQKKENMACLFISHDLELVSEVADHIAVMQHGKIVENKVKLRYLKTDTPTQKPYWPADPIFIKVPTQPTKRLS